MSRNKVLLFKEILSDLAQANRVLETVDLTNVTYEELRTAASSAQQAASNLHRLAGMVDVLADDNQVVNLSKNSKKLFNVP